MDYEKIGEDFVRKARVKMNLMTEKEKLLYADGMIDVLDSIGKVHPNLVFDLFHIREAVEEKLDEVM